MTNPIATAIVVIFLQIIVAAQEAESRPLATVLHVTRAKIIESNSVATRPGSVYDNTTVFELHPGVKPRFMYEFIDTGLGTAEPLYPHYQRGHQASWFQLFPAWFSEKNRHIDHFSSVDTPEGCRQDALYALRHISEFPSHMFQKERAEGYDKAVVRFEYYTRLRPGAECGRHRSHDPDPKLTTKDLFRIFNRYRNVHSIEEIPKDFRDKIETRVAVVYHLKEIRPCRDCAVDRSGFANNSLWYYPDGHAVDHGYDDDHEIPGTGKTLKAQDLVRPADAFLQARYPLLSVLSENEFQQLLGFLNGKPYPSFDPSDEPGDDVLYIDEVTSKNIYSSGRRVIPIGDVHAMVSNPNNYKLVGVTLKPFAEPEHPNFDHLKHIPQVRLVYQLHDASTGTNLEQLFVHVNFDAVNRRASFEQQEREHRLFLERIANRISLDELLSYYAGPDRAEDVSVSSALTGIWVFGRYTRSTNQGFAPLRTVRHGVDVGYYSTVYDNDLFRQAIAEEVPQKDKLQEIIDRLTVSTYRDAKRMDVHNINFRSVTCAQCHHLAGRDAVHLEFNDFIDSRFTYPVRGSEFLYKDSDRLLRMGALFKSPVEL